MVNAFLLDSADGLAVIDAGTPGAEERILAAVGSIGRTTDDVRHILVTHVHGDHIGGLQALRKRTCAQVWMHAADAKLASRGLTRRAFTPASRANPIVRLGMRAQRSVVPVVVSHLVEDGDVLPVAGGSALSIPQATPSGMSHSSSRRAAACYSSATPPRT
jgi:glyoxylase-like metal-dependent hydrolase (beta-lactamase superfamily II)